MVGRPAYTEGEARTEVLRVRVKPMSKDVFLQECERRKVDPADAMREALNLWMRHV